MKKCRKDQCLDHLSSLSEDEFARVIYSMRLGQVYSTVAIFEHSLIQALLIPSKIELGVERRHSSPIDQMLAKREAPHDATLGNLIKVLVDHGINEAEISYLRFIKRKRDYFVHRFFSDWPWPGDLRQHMLDPMLRKLLYLEFIFGRATDRIPAILSRSGLIEVIDLGNDGYLYVNDWPDLSEHQ